TFPSYAPRGHAASLTNGVLVPSYTRPREGDASDMTDDGDTKADVSKRAPEAGEDVAARLAALETELEKAREEARQSHERWLRDRAELENLKKRIARERAETMKFANGRVLGDLPPACAGERGQGARPEPCQGQGP